MREPKSNQSVDIPNTDRNNSGRSYSNSGRSNSSYSSPSSYGFPDPTKGISNLFDRYGNKLNKFSILIVVLVDTIIVRVDIGISLNWGLSIFFYNIIYLNSILFSFFL